MAKEPTRQPFLPFYRQIYFIRWLTVDTLLLPRSFTLWPALTHSLSLFLCVYLWNYYQPAHVHFFHTIFLCPNTLRIVLFLLLVQASTMQLHISVGSFVPHRAAMKNSTSGERTWRKAPPVSFSFSWLFCFIICRYFFFLRCARCIFNGTQLDRAVIGWTQARG